MDNSEQARRKRLILHSAAMMGVGAIGFAGGGGADHSEGYADDLYSARLGTLDSLRALYEGSASPAAPPAPSPPSVATLEGQLDDTTSEPAAPPVIWTLQAIVEKTSRGPEGYGIEVIEPAWNFYLDAIARDPAGMQSLNADQWEQMLAAYYTKEGYNVILTPRSGDQGRDLIAEKPGRYVVRILEQMKAYRPDLTVTAEEVAGFMHTLNSDRRATHGIISTTAKFAPRIMNDARIAPHVGGRLTLVDGTTLRANLLEQRSKGKLAE